MNSEKRSGLRLSPWGQPTDDKKGSEKQSEEYLMNIFVWEYMEERREQISNGIPKSWSLEKSKIRSTESKADL